MSTTTPQHSAQPVHDSARSKKQPVTSNSAKQQRRSQAARKRKSSTNRSRHRASPTGKSSEPFTRQAQKQERSSQDIESLDERVEDSFRFTVAHAFILLGYLTGTGLLVIFGLDLAIEIPFNRESVSFDIANVAAGLTLIYLSYNCQRDPN